MNHPIKIGASPLRKVLTDGSNKSLRVKEEMNLNNNLPEKEMNSVNKLKVPASAMCFSEPADINLSQPDDDGKQYFSMSAYSGQIIKDHSWWGDLAIDVEGIQFKQKRIPILEEHYLNKKLGISNSKPSIENNVVKFEKIKLLSNPTAAEFKQNLDDEFPYQASISIRPFLVEHLEEGAKAEVNGYTMKGPGRIIRQSLFREASACVFGADHRTSVQSLSDEENDIEVDLKLVESPTKTKQPVKVKKVKGEKRMDFSDVKESHPDIYVRLTEALNAKGVEITDLTEKLETANQSITDLTATNKTLTDRNAELERAVVVHNEKKLASKAEVIALKLLKDSKLSERIQKRIGKTLNHEDFVSDDDKLDVEKFTEYVEGEITSWKEDFKDADTASSIMGLSGTGEDEDDKETEDLSDTLVNFALNTKNK